MRILVLLAAICSLNNSFGQSITRLNVDSLVNVQVDRLIRNNFSDKVLIYRTGCFGCRDNQDCRCSTGDGVSYIIWQDSSQLTIHRIDCCDINKPISLKSTKIWNELTENETKIFTSDFICKSLRTHFFFDEIILVSKTQRLTVDIYDYYFEKGDKFFKDDKPNVYRKHNLRQPAKKFIDKLKDLLTTYKSG